MSVRRLVLTRLKVAPGIAWSTAHWSSPEKAPAAVRPASAVNAAASSALLRRNTHPDCVRNDLEMHRRGTDLLAVELDRQALGCIDGNRV